MITGDGNCEETIFNPSLHSFIIFKPFVIGPMIRVRDAGLFLDRATFTAREHLRRERKARKLTVKRKWGSFSWGIMVISR